MPGMKNAAITALWAINAWYIANFASVMTDAPSVGPLAAVTGGAIAYLTLTRRSRARFSARVAATA
jgi:hypothetical protein